MTDRGSVVRAHVFVSGRVQGVYFRYYTEEFARRDALTGFVRNRRDGRVEAVFEGARQAVERAIEMCRAGPAGAAVTDVSVDWEDATGEFADFTLRGTA